MRAVQIKEFGGPEVLEVVDLPDPEPGPDEVVVEVTRAGMNFADTHQRENDYLAKAELPLIPGGEIAGRSKMRDLVAAHLGCSLLEAEELVDTLIARGFARLERDPEGRVGWRPMMGA